MPCPDRDRRRESRRHPPPFFFSSLFSFSFLLSFFFSFPFSLLLPPLFFLPAPCSPTHSMRGTRSTSTPDARRAARRPAQHHRRPLAPPTPCAAVSTCSPLTLAPLSDDRKWPHGHSVAIDGEQGSVGTAPPQSPIYRPFVQLFTSTTPPAAARLLSNSNFVLALFFTKNRLSVDLPDQDAVVQLPRR